MDNCGAAMARLGRHVVVQKKERYIQIVMTKKEYRENAIALANRCKLFAEKSCLDWKAATPADTAFWYDLGEMRELYYSLLTLRHAAEVVVQRAKLIK